MDNETNHSFDSAVIESNEDHSNENNITGIRNPASREQLIRSRANSISPANDSRNRGGINSHRFYSLNSNDVALSNRNSTNLSRFTYKSSDHHRKASRSSAVAEVISGVIGPSSTTLTIPFKLSQVVFSVGTICKPKTTLVEKCMHGVQASLALTQTILLAIMFFQNMECVDKSNNLTGLCQLFTFISYCYDATLLLGWVPSEISKAPYELSVGDERTIDEREGLHSHA